MLNLPSLLQVDGRMWGSGSLKSDLELGRFPPAGIEFHMEGSVIPPYMAADSAFPETKHILKRFAKRQLQGPLDHRFPLMFYSFIRNRNTFNRCHSSARARIEMFWFVLYVSYFVTIAGVDSPVDSVFSRQQCIWEGTTFSLE